MRGKFSFLLLLVRVRRVVFMLVVFVPAKNNMTSCRVCVLVFFVVIHVGSFKVETRPKNTNCHRLGQIPSSPRFDNFYHYTSIHLGIFQNYKDFDIPNFFEKKNCPPINNKNYHNEKY